MYRETGRDRRRQERTNVNEVGGRRGLEEREREILAAVLVSQI